MQMGRGRYKFSLFSFYQIRNMQIAATPYKDRDRRVYYRSSGSSTESKHTARHKMNVAAKASKKASASQLGESAPSTSASTSASASASGPESGNSSASTLSPGKGTRQGRFPLPSWLVQAQPDGFPPGLDERTVCGKGLKFVDIPIKLFVENEEHLASIVHQHLTPQNLTASRRLAARKALQDWVLGQLRRIAEEELDAVPGGPSVNVSHSCRGCKFDRS